MPRPARRYRAALFLLLGGLVIVVAGVALAQRWAQASRPPIAVPTAAGAQSAAGPTRAFALSATAAGAAARLPTITPIATAGAPAARPSAPVRITVARLGIDARVVEVGWHVERSAGGERAVWETVVGAAGHHQGSADPGRAGNCVLSGHSSAEGGAVFAGLAGVRRGDIIELSTTAGERYAYVVTEVATVDETGATEAEKREHARWLDPTLDPSVTLVACWPDWSYTHRIIVRGLLKTS
jgi:sortase A